MRRRRNRARRGERHLGLRQRRPSVRQFRLETRGDGHGGLARGVRRPHPLLRVFRGGGALLKDGPPRLLRVRLRALSRRGEVEVEPTLHQRHLLLRLGASLRPVAPRALHRLVRARERRGLRAVRALARLLHEDPSARVGLVHRALGGGARLRALALEPVLHQLELAGGVAAPGLGGVRAAALRVRLLSRALDVRARLGHRPRVLLPPRRLRLRELVHLPLERPRREALPRPQLLSHRSLASGRHLAIRGGDVRGLQRRVEPVAQTLDLLLRRLRGRHGLHRSSEVRARAAPLRREVRLQRSRRLPKRRELSLRDGGAFHQRGVVGLRHLQLAKHRLRGGGGHARGALRRLGRARRRRRLVPGARLLELALERLDALEARTDDVVALAHVAPKLRHARALLRRGLRQRRVVLGLSPVHPERRREVLDALLRVEELHLHVRVRPGLGVRQLQKLLGRHVRREAQQTVVPPVVSRRVLVVPARGRDEPAGVGHRPEREESNARGPPSWNDRRLSAGVF